MESEKFIKKKDYLICVDSDGCVMDTMDIKHKRCFGPCMIEEWELNSWRQELLERWAEINLYTVTRGINRFKGLALALSEINRRYKKIEGLAVFLEWTDTSGELSNDAVKSAINKALEASREAGCLKKALSWSEAVNDAINQIPDGKKLPFEGVKEALSYAHRYADVAVVSSANGQAVVDEWSKYGLLDHTDVVLAQNAGSKEYCISQLIKKGYARDHVVMTGDAPGDLKAAGENQVYFYPILVGKEKESWKGYEEAVNHLLHGTYKGRYEEELKRRFLENLGAGPADSK